MSIRLRFLFARPAALLGALAVLAIAPLGRAQTAPPYPLISQLVNLSVRSKLGVGQPLVVGFVITGRSDTTARVLVRGIGPSLASLGVTDAMPNPKLVLAALTSTGTTEVVVDDWNTPARPLASRGGITQQPIDRWFNAFGLENDSKDAALLAELKPGAYTVTVSGATPAEAGTVLMEVYNVEVRDQAGAARLSNLSVLGYTSPDNPLTAGWVYQGFTSANLLARAVGPGLSAFGVTDAVPHAQLDFLNGRGAFLFGNSNWDTEQLSVFGVFPQVRLAGLRVGAFPLASGSLDAALTVPLAPSVGYETVNNSTIVHMVRGTGFGGTSGRILLELYEYGVQGQN